MAEKIIRTAIAEFILQQPNQLEHRVQPGERVELTASQFARFAAAGCVHSDETLDREISEQASEKVKAAAKVAADDQMRTEAGEKAAREADAEAREQTAASAHAEGGDAGAASSAARPSGRKATRK